MKPHLAETTYDGPIRESRVKAGGQTITLIRPGEPDRLLDDPKVLARNVAEDYMPYWAYLWPGAYLLADALAGGGWPQGLPALEIGCGLGLTGLVAVALGFRVHFTDHDATTLDFVERSARANQFDPSTYSTALLDWSDPTPQRYPLILGADVTYEKRLLPLVAGVIAAMLEPEGIALVSDPNRGAAEGFTDILAAAGLSNDPIRAEADTDELGHVRGMIHRIRFAR